MLLIPYRTKNPPEHFPFVTIGLIALNTLIFIGTIDSSTLTVRQDVVRAYAVSHNTMSLFRLVTAMFLHASIMHLVGNMLVLGIFGFAVEGRLGPIKFLLVYLLTGICGSLLQDLVTGFAFPDMPNLGASGAIMGLAGAYLFIFPYAKICVFYFAWVVRLFFGVADWHARWVVLYFTGFDLFEGVLSGGMDGVGHFAHLGGAGAGFLLMMALRVHRDSEWRSDAQSARSEVHSDWSTMNFDQLEALLEHPTDNEAMLMAFFKAAAGRTDGQAQLAILNVMRQHRRLLLAQPDLMPVARAALRVSLQVGHMPPEFYLLLGSRLENADVNTACQLYRRVYDIDPQSPDTEMALYRATRLMEEKMSDPAHATAANTELLRRFPHGEMALNATDALRRLSKRGTGQQANPTLYR